MPTIALVRIASEFDGTQADSPRHRLCSERRPHDGMLPPQAGIGMKRGLPSESCVGHERPSPSSVCFSPHAEDERFNFSHPRPKPASFGRFKQACPEARVFWAFPSSYSWSPPPAKLPGSAGIHAPRGFQADIPGGPYSIRLAWPPPPQRPFHADFRARCPEMPATSGRVAGNSWRLRALIYRRTSLTSCIGAEAPRATLDYGRRSR